MASEGLSMGKGSSNAGRPRKGGERHPGGQLKRNVAPNERVLADRRAMLGDDKLDVSTASDPLDFALARGFLSLGRYRAALSFAEVYGRTGMGGPRLSSGGVAEASTTLAPDERLRSHVGAKNQWQTMTRSQIAGVFDQVFNVTGGAHAEDRQIAAMQRWKGMIAPLTPDERSELMAVCVHRSWPQWIVWMARGKDIPPIWDRKRVLLEGGLDKVANTLRGLWKAARDEQKPRGWSLDQEVQSGPTVTTAGTELPSPPRGPKILEHLLFVDEDGEPVQLASERGKPFEVQRKVRR